MKILVIYSFTLLLLYGIHGLPTESQASAEEGEFSVIFILIFFLEFFQSILKHFLAYNALKFFKLIIPKEFIQIILKHILLWLISSVLLLLLLIYLFLKKKCTK
jgi:hypothetical protein